MFQIRWENQASEELVEILEFWNKHNQSEAYSKILYEEIKRIEELLETNPQIGEETNYKDIRRAIILYNYSLFYIISKRKKAIYIISFWDNRRNPDDLKL